MDDLPIYRDRRTERFANGERVKAFEAIRDKANQKLKLFDSMTRLQDVMALPSNRFEALHGNREGQYSIRINDQWRICFQWSNEMNKAYNIEIVDYH